MSIQRVKQTAHLVLHHARRHSGVGLICAVAYFDPGNWGVDLQAGSTYGYRLLFVVLLAGIFAIFFQVSASKLGCVTGLDLASHCRLMLYDRPKYKLFCRWALMYPLYLVSEVAIIATDLAELLGSAIALSLIFPRLELWHGVLITALDVIFILAFGDPLRGRPVKFFEVLIAGLVISVLICMCIVIAKIDVHWGDAFLGYVPSKYIFHSGGLYTSVGIIGATVMPHSLFLGSALATQDRVSFKPIPDEDIDNLSDKEQQKELPQSLTRRSAKKVIVYIQSAFKTPPPSVYATTAKRHDERENNSLGFVRAHINHGIADMVISLLGFAVVINSLILILASAVFFYNDVDTADTASLFDAYDLIRDMVGQPAATLFAIALLAAGQSSSIIATVAGQAVSEGFLQWRVSPVIRRLLTRLLALIPALAVAIGVGRSGIDDLLVASQVVLSIVLPFVTFPLIYLTGKHSGIMKVRGPDDAEGGATYVDFSNGWVVMGCSWVIWLVVVAANVYVIVDLGIGE